MDLGLGKQSLEEKYTKSMEYYCSMLEMVAFNLAQRAASLQKRPRHFKRDVERSAEKFVDSCILTDQLPLQMEKVLPDSQDIDHFLQLRRLWLDTMPYIGQNDLKDLNQTHDLYSIYTVAEKNEKGKLSSSELRKHGREKLVYVPKKESSGFFQNFVVKYFCSTEIADTCEDRSSGMRMFYTMVSNSLKCCAYTIILNCPDLGKFILLQKNNEHFDEKNAMHHQAFQDFLAQGIEKRFSVAQRHPHMLFLCENGEMVSARDVYKPHNFTFVPQTTDIQIIDGFWRFGSERLHSSSEHQDLASKKRVLSLREEPHRACKQVQNLVEKTSQNIARFCQQAFSLSKASQTKRIQTHPRSVGF